MTGNKINSVINDESGKRTHTDLLDLYMIHTDKKILIKESIQRS